MKSRRLKRAILIRLTALPLMAAMLLAPAYGFQAPADLAVTLDLAADDQIPGAELMVTAVLSVAEGTKLGTLRAQISFPSGMISFQELKRGLSIEAAGAEVTTELKTDEPGAGVNTLNVAVISKSGNPIPTGILADLVFKLSKETKPDEKIVLKNKVTALNTSSQPIVSVGGTDGKVTVLDKPPAVFSCFFYMH